MASPLNVINFGSLTHIIDPCACITSFGTQVALYSKWHPLINLIKFIIF